MTDQRNALPLPTRRGLSRTEAAALVGIGATTFDRMVSEGRMPKPARVYGRILWDARQIDAAMDSLFTGAEADAEPNEWDSINAQTQ